MKRKLIASLLCLCMLVSLLPVAAFATVDENTTETKAPDVIASNIVDTSNVSVKPYTGTPTAALDKATNTITVTVDNLKCHTNGAGTRGYWVGVGIPKVDGDQYMFGLGDAPQSIEHQSSYYTSEQIVNGQEYRTFYFDAIKSDTAWISVKSAADSTKEGGSSADTSNIVTYKVDLSNVSLNLDVVPANLTGGTPARPQGDNADVYTVSGVKAADGTPTITVTATGLKEHANGATPPVNGYWVGVGLPTITAPKSGSVKYAWGFGQYPTSIAANDWKENTRYQGDTNKYTTFYFAADGTDDKWADGGYIAVQITKSDNTTTTYHYNINFDVQQYSGLAINGMGFEAVGTDANTAINSKVQLNTPVADCDVNTMYAYFNSLFQGNDTVPVELAFKNPNNEVVYTWKNEAARVVYFTFNQQGGSPAAKPISSGTYTAELKVGGNVVSTRSLDIYSVSYDAAGGTGLAATSPTYYEKGKEITLPTGLTKENFVFAGWKDNKDNVVSGTQTVTGDVTYTAQWDEVKIVSASLKQTSGDTSTDVAGVSAAVDGTIIKLTGSIAQPVADTGTAYTLAYTTNAKSSNTGNITVTLKYESNKLVATVSGNTVNGKTYTVNVDDLKVLPANVTIADGGVAAVDESKIAGNGLTPAEKATLVNNIKATTGSFDTQSETLSAQLAEVATTLTEEEVTSKLDEAKEDAANATVAATYTTLAVVPVLSINSVDYDRASEEMTLEITPAVQYQAVSTAPQTNANIPVGDPIPMSKEDAANIGPVKISFKAPAFAGTPSAESKLYVTHTASTGTYEYTATYSITDSVYTFTNPNGFSTFVVSKTSDAVAYIGGVGYMTLKEAVEAAKDGNTIVLHKKLEGSAASITASLSSDKTLTFKDADANVKNTTLTINGKEVTINTTGVTVTIPKNGGTKPTDPSTPGSGGGGGGVSSNVTIDRPTNGKVSVSPTAPSKGATVTITLTPDTGYVVGSVTVTDKDGKAVELTKVSDTKYTFTMPDGKVKVAATFTKAGAEGFTDVPADAYYADAVKWAVEKGITNGLTATTFGPNNSCTRGQMVTFLWRAAGSPAATGTNSFSDVASGEYYYNAVLWAVEKGITNGTSATTFSPNATVNRGQTVTFLYRYAESPAATGESSFTDVAADAFYADAVKWAVAEEITNGTSSTTFSPASNCTRGQIVTFMYRQMAE